MGLEDYLADDSPLHDLRSKAIKRFEAQGFPNKKQEAWKYTSLKGLLKHNYTIATKKENALEFKDVKQYFLHDLDTYKVVFVDGVYNSFLSETTHYKLDVCFLSAAISKSKYKSVI